MAKKKKEEQLSRYKQFDAWYDKQLLNLKSFWDEYLGIKYIPIVILATILLVLLLCWLFNEKWTDVFRALLVPVIAIAAVAISWMQYEIKTQEREQYDFEKKWAAYHELSLVFERLEREMKDGVNEEQLFNDLSGYLDKARLFGIMFGQSAVVGLTEQVKEVADLINDDTNSWEDCRNRTSELRGELFHMCFDKNYKKMTPPK